MDLHNHLSYMPTSIADLDWTIPSGLPVIFSEYEPRHSWIGVICESG